MSILRIKFKKLKTFLPVMGRDEYFLFILNEIRHRGCKYFGKNTFSILKLKLLVLKNTMNLEYS